MAYISAIAVDFGSTNSGCARIVSFDENGKLKYDTPHLVHSTGTYAKDNTWFYIEPSFLERVISNYDSLSDADFRIESRVIHSNNPNILWGRQSIKEFSDKLVSEKWISFKNFKMLLRDGVNDTMLDFPLVTIIKTFLRILKIECLSLESDRLGRNVLADEIQWGVTIPAIWNDENKRIMVECAHSVFSKKARILSEPEGPLVANLLMSGNGGKVEYKDGRTSLVIDMGGGTTDICLMKEVKQSDGEFKFEMIADTDGSAAGGNDVDNNFYLYMLRFISKGKTSDSGIAYDSLDDDTLLREAFNGFKANIKSFEDFEDNWLKLKSERNLGQKSTCDFEFTKDFRLWLAENGHKQLADSVKEMLVDGCEFPSVSFVEQVLTPTFKKICDKIKEIILSNMQKVSFDNIILAGGMSQNHSLNVMVKETIRELLGESGESAIREAPGLFAGSAIMTGTCFLLVNRDFIERLAKRNYYYDCCVDNITSCLREDYAALGLNIKGGEINSILDDEDSNDFDMPGRSGSIILRPIVLKDHIVHPYHRTLSTGANQTHVNVELFSTDGKVVIYANKKNPDLTKEGEIDATCKENTSYDLEVDFNEAQISNALHYIFKEYGTDEVIAEDYINEIIAD